METDSWYIENYKNLTSFVENQILIFMGKSYYERYKDDICQEIMIKFLKVYREKGETNLNYYYKICKNYLIDKNKKENNTNNNYSFIYVDDWDNIEIDSFYYRNNLDDYTHLIRDDIMDIERFIELYSSKKDVKKLQNLLKVSGLNYKDLPPKAKTKIGDEKYTAKILGYKDNNRAYRKAKNQALNSLKKYLRVTDNFEKHNKQDNI